MSEEEFDELLEPTSLNRKFVVHKAFHKSFEHNYKAVFSSVIKTESKFQLRSQDINTLIKYQHYDEIKMSFGKVVHTSLMELFYDKKLKNKDPDAYKKFCLEFFIDAMIDLSYSPQDVIDFV